MEGDIAVKDRRDKKKQADGQHLPATAEVQALLDLAAQETLALPPSSCRARTLADLAKQATQLKAIGQLDQRVAQLEEVLSQRRSDQAASDRYSGGGASQRYGHSSRFAVPTVLHLAQRVEGLYPELSAKERATLALRSMKIDEPEDPAVRSTMPPEQVTEFNRLISLIHGVNQGLGPVAFLVNERIGTVTVRLALLQMVLRLGGVSDVCRSFLTWRTKEPITQSEYSQKVDEAREKLVPVREVASWEADEFDGWQPDELVGVPSWRGDGSHDEVPSDEAWQRMAARKEAMLKDLMAQGTLEGVQTDEGMCIRLGGYYDWKGQEAPVLPEFADSFDIRPDGEAADVDRWRVERAALQRHLVATNADELPLLEDVIARTSSWCKQKKALKKSIRESIRSCWAEIEAIQTIIQKTREEFDGEDPAYPELRELLDDTAKQLEELHEESKKLVGNYRLPKPRDEQKSLMRELVDSWATP